MRVPVRRLPETRVSEQQQGYARPVAPVNVSPITDLIESARNQILDGQDARQRIDLNRRLITEVNELSTDFATRQRNPEVSPIDFANSTNTTYAERHAALLSELRQENYSEDLLNDFESRLGTVRQGFFERGLVHQVAQLRARAGEEIEDLGVNASQYAAVDPIHNYATARDMVRDSVRTHPDLTEDERAALEDQQLAVVRDAGARALAIQNPQLIIDTFDPEGRTAPYPTTTASGGTAAPSVSTVGSAREDFKSRVRANESGGDDSIRNRTGSSATGRYQFIDSTWLSMHRQVFGGNMTDAQRLAQRTDGAIQEQIMDASIVQYEQALVAGGQEVTAGNLYLSHFFGPQTAVRILQNPNALLSSILGRNAGITFRQNPNLRRTMTGADVIALTTRAMGGAPEAPAFRPAPTQVASAPRFIDQPETQSAPTSVPPAGLRVPGNIDLTARPVVNNPDGSVSTIRSISISTDEGEVLIPTIVNGQPVSEEEAIAHYRETGEHLGIFENEQIATAYAQQLHNQEARRTDNIAAIRTGNPLLDDLNGSERLQLLSRAREQQTRVLATQRAQMDVRIGNITSEALNNGGEIAAPIPTEQEVLQTYGPIEGPQRWAQITQSQATGRAIVTFRTQSADTIQQSLDRLEPQPGDPAYQSKLQIYQAAERAAQALLTERQQDPAAYALRYFPQVRQAAQQGTAQYYAALDRVYQTLGIDPRTAPVMTADATRELTQSYRSMNATQRRQFMQQNMSEMGEARFRRFVRNMEGTTAESDARIYALLRDYPGAAVTGNLYNQILEGREIIAQDPARRPRSEEVLKVFRETGLNSVRDLDAETSRSIQEAAEGLYAQRGGDPVHIDRTLYREALTAVLGGSLPADMRRGRVPDYTILPPRVTEQQFRTWMEGLTIQGLTAYGTERQAPRWGDLRTPVPIQSIIDEGVFVMVSPGYYSIRMASDGRPLMTSNGNRYIMRVGSPGIMSIRPGQTPAAPRRSMSGGVM